MSTEKTHPEPNAHAGKQPNPQGTGKQPNSPDTGKQPNTDARKKLNSQDAGYVSDVALAPEGRADCRDTFCTLPTAWCPGCGNFGILPSLKRALTELGLDPHEVLMVAGIGQAAKVPQYISANGFCGLHGRAMPAAVAAKIANSRLTVIVESGDGDTYGEGGNHFLHNVRRNVDIAHFVHDNQVYGLTKGQVSPTSDLGHKTTVQVEGNSVPPLNPILLALSLGAGFVARGFSDDQDQLVDLMKQAITFKGYALVDILQPCVSFNKINTHAWYSERVQPLPDSHDPTNLAQAIEWAMKDGDRIPTGVFYKVEHPTYHDRVIALQKGIPLIERPYDQAALKQAMAEFT